MDEMLQIRTVRKEPGAEIAENREAIRRLREDLAAFKGRMDAKIDDYGARIDLLEARVATTGEDVAFIKGLLTGGGSGLSHAVARLVGWPLF